MSFNLIFCFYNFINSFLAAQAKNYYHLVGLIIGRSVLQGGSGGNFFSKTMFNSVAYGAGLKDANMEDIPDNEVLVNLAKVQYRLIHCFFQVFRIYNFIIHNL